MKREYTDYSDLTWPQIILAAIILVFAFLVFGVYRLGCWLLEVVIRVAERF